MRWTLGAIAVLALASPDRAMPAQQPGHMMHEMPAPVFDSVPGSELVVYVLTIGQGDEIWEKFGHNSIWITNRRFGQSIAYNWGVFDFRQPGFIPRFLANTSVYTMDGNDAGATVEFYRRLNRTMWLQEIALTPSQRLALQNYIEWNARPGNREYHYDYFRDNCSTRVRDVLDRAMGGTLRTALIGRPTSSTYRSETRRLTAHNIWTYAGIEAALGEPADHPLDAWQESFIPMRLRDHLASLRVSDGKGGTQPLVLSERVLFTATRAAELATPPDRRLGFLVTGLVIGGLIAGLGERARRGGRGARRVYASMTSVVCAVIGVLGVVLGVAWLATQHVFWYRNENLLQLSPLALGLAVLIPLSMSRPRFITAACWLSGIIASLSLLGLLLKPFGLHQVNGEIIALMLPVHGAIALSLWRVLTEGRTVPMSVETPAIAA